MNRTALSVRLFLCHPLRSNQILKELSTARISAKFLEDISTFPVCPVFEFST